MTTTQVIVVEYPRTEEREIPDELARLKRCLAVREVTLLRSYRSFRPHEAHADFRSARRRRRALRPCVRRTHERGRLAR